MSTAVPPHPPIPEQELSFLGFLRAVRTNALTMWTEAAYQEDVVVRRFLGRSQMLLNAPDVATNYWTVPNATNGVISGGPSHLPLRRGTCRCWHGML